MAYKIRWSPRAVAHLQEICGFIAKDSEYYAAFFAKKVMAIVESLVEFPKSGRIVPEYQNENLRERIFGNYRIVYRLKDGAIEIAAISHAARLLLPMK